MSESTLTALQQSIAHWERMLGFTNKEQFDEENPGSGHCVLCKKHRHKHSTLAPCHECPVSKLTNQVYCRGTPHAAALDVCHDLMQGNHQQWGRWRTVAQAEIDFLKGLLP